VEKQTLYINGISSVLWGAASKCLFIAVHGDSSHKEDDVIRIFAGKAVGKGYQVLSFDLPEHGDRKAENRLCKVQNCIEDLNAIMQYARAQAKEISLFGCSMGAYFAMMAYRDEPILQTLFLSPVVDMLRIIQNMMTWFEVSEERLQKEREIATPVKTFYWDYYQYVKEHPVEWDKPTKLLYGIKDTLCEPDYVKNFAEQTHAAMTVMEDGEHFFHTQEQLACFRGWLCETLEGKTMTLETIRLLLRTWKQSDAENLYKYAKDPRVGPIAGWPVHTSVENSRDIIREVLSAAETYAVTVKGDDTAIGSIGLMIGGISNLGIPENEGEIGYWIAVPYWGQGYIPEATGELMRHGFEDLGLTAIWCGYFDGNEKSKRVGEKCGFQYVRTEKKHWPLIGETKTQHITRMTKEEWMRRNEQ